MKQLRRLFSPTSVKNTVSAVWQRFPYPFIFAILLTAWEIISLYEWTESFDVAFRSVNWALAEGFLLTLAATVWCEFSGKRKLLKILLPCAVVLVAADLALLLYRGGPENDAESIGRLAFSSALVTAILFLPALKRYNRSQMWSYTVSQFESVAFAVCLGIVMTIATFIIFGTLDLLFGISNYRYYVTSICLFGWLMPCVIYLSKIPEPDFDADSSLSLKASVAAICKNIILPLVLIYTIILYVYAAKILFTWTLPNASITWMVTGLMIIALITLYGLQLYSFDGTIHENGARIASLVRRWLPWVLLPLLVLMSVGLIYRFREYGITVSRLYVAAFNVWAYSVVLYLILRRNANLNIAAMSFAIVFAAVSIIPGFNFTSLSTRIIRSQIIEAFHRVGVDKLPVDTKEASEALSRMSGREARSTASRIEYLDDWNDHAAVSDIVVSDSKIFEFAILPEKFQSIDTVEVVEQPIFGLQAEEPVSIPAGYTRVKFVGHFYENVSTALDSVPGVHELGLDDYSVMLNTDSLGKIQRDSIPLALPAKSKSGDALIMFNKLTIEDIPGDSAQVYRGSYYIFTK